MAIEWISSDSQAPRQPGVYAVVVEEEFCGGFGLRKWCQAYWLGDKWIPLCEPIEGLVTYWAKVELPE